MTSLALLYVRKHCRTGPVLLDLTFVLPRPKSLPKRVSYHLKKPDVDKLARCVLDGLTGVVYRDDSQVVTVSAHKRYQKAGEQTGCIVGVQSDEEKTPGVV